MSHVKVVDHTFDNADSVEAWKDGTVFLSGTLPSGKQWGTALPLTLWLELARRRGFGGPIEGGSVSLKVHD